MPEKCTDNPRDCPMRPRVEALEKLQEGHSVTHKEMFSRLNALERGEAAQLVQYQAIMSKLEDLTQKVESLEAKPGRRWESIVEKALWAVVAAVIAFLLAKIGL